jgi:hypothetical protein
MFMRCLLAGLAALGVILLPVARGGDGTKASTNAENDPTLVKMASMIGGIWTNDNPKFLVEFKYDWAFGKKAVRGTGVIAKGSPQETEVEALIGWDPIRKGCYYLDVHGGSTVFQGTVKLDDDSVVFEFETLVGKAAKWRSVGKFPDRDTYAFKIYGRKDGEWVQHVEQTLKRKRSEQTKTGTR